MIVRLMLNKLYEPGQFVSIYSGTYLMAKDKMEFLAFNQEVVFNERMLIESIYPVSEIIETAHVNSGKESSFLYTGFMVHLYGSDYATIQESLRLLPNTALKERADELSNACV